jgi:hypothetical protein
MTSGDATGKCAGELGRAWTSPEDIETTPQIRIAAIFDI